MKQKIVVPRFSHAAWPVPKIISSMRYCRGVGAATSRWEKYKGKSPSETNKNSIFEPDSAHFSYPKPSHPYRTLPISACVTILLYNQRLQTVPLPLAFTSSEMKNFLVLYSFFHVSNEISRIIILYDLEQFFTTLFCFYIVKFIFKILMHSFHFNRLPSGFHPISPSISLR